MGWANDLCASKFSDPDMMNNADGYQNLESPLTLDLAVTPPRPMLLLQLMRPSLQPAM